MCLEMCDDKAHKEVENVLHYVCLKNCVKVYRMKKKAQAAAIPKDAGDDMIKKGKKIDWLPKNTCQGGKNESKWVAAHISNVDNPSENMYKLEIK